MEARVRTWIGLMLAMTMMGCGQRVADPSTHRVLVFGIDAADYELTRAMLDAGELPNLDRLRRNGVFGPLLSEEPMLSPPLWTTIATGKDRHQHGILGFTADGSETSAGELHSSRLLRVRRLWDMAGDVGRSVGVVNWWVTWPATRVNGYMLSNMWPTSQNLVSELQAKGRSLPEGVPLVEAYRTSVYPPELLAELEQFVVSDADISSEQLADLHLSRADFRFVWDLPELETRTAAGLHLYETRSPDLAMVFYGMLDHVSHQYFATDQWPVRAVYRMLDEILGRYLDLAGRDALVAVVSDHGFMADERLGPGAAMHGKDGVIFLSGPQIWPGSVPRHARVHDVTPTLLACMGLPVARDMDGRVLGEVMDPRLLERYPVRWIDTYETGPLPEVVAGTDNPFEEGMKERLRALGYLE